MIAKRSNRRSNRTRAGRRALLILPLIDVIDPRTCVRRGGNLPDGRRSGDMTGQASGPMPRLTLEPGFNLTHLNRLDRQGGLQNAKAYFGRFRNPGNAGGRATRHTGRCSPKPVVLQVQGNDKLQIRHPGAMSRVHERKRRYLLPSAGVTLIARRGSDSPSRAMAPDDALVGAIRRLWMIMYRDAGSRIDAAGDFRPRYLAATCPSMHGVGCSECRKAAT